MGSIIDKSHYFIMQPILCKYQRQLLKILFVKAPTQKRVEITSRLEVKTIAIVTLLLLKNIGLLLMISFAFFEVKK